MPQVVVAGKQNRRERRSVRETERPPVMPRMLVDEGGAEYRVLASESVEASGERLVLVVERLSAHLEQLRGAFGLTPREARIAQLLAHRATNQEIAERLHISRHTARRHTERVLAKLGVTSRAQVRARLVAGTEDRPKIQEGR